MSGQAEAPMDLSHEPVTGIKLGKKKYKMMHGSLNSRSNPIIGDKILPETNNNEVRLLSLPNKQSNLNAGQTTASATTLQSVLPASDLKQQQQQLLQLQQQQQQPQTQSQQANEKLINQAVELKNNDKDSSRKRHPAEVQTSNPILRGKHGLRPLPQQVDYYQSVLEDRKARANRESSKHSKDESGGNELVIVESTPLKRSRRSTSDHSKGSTKESKEQTQISKESFTIGDIVWATLPTYKTWFPGLIISHIHCGQRPAKSGQTWVYWFGDHQVSEIPKAKVKTFINHFNDFSKGTSSLTSSRMKEALQVLANRAGIVFDMATNDSDEQLINWAKNGFQVSSEKMLARKNCSSLNPFAPDPLNPIPSIAACYLPLDMLNLTALKTDDRLQQIAFYEVESAETIQEEKDEPLIIPEFKQAQVTRIKKGEIKITDICIACCCDHNPAADVVNGAKVHHPLFDGLLCKQCNETIKCTMYAPGDDNKNSFCAICGQVGKLAVCDNSICHRVFCFVCIQLYIGVEEHSKIVDAKTWECYICNEKNLPSTALLKGKQNWRANVKSLYDPIRCLKQIQNNEAFLKRPIKVLSIFDGISSAKFVLKALRLQVSHYYAIESDKDAISVSKHHHGESVTYIEKIDDLTPEKIAAICPIDLVVCSSSWNEVSTLSTSRKGFFDVKGSGYPFLYFIHALNLVRQLNNDNHVFFFFDTLTSIPNVYRDTISLLSMCKPVTLNLRYQLNETSQYIWSNIPGVNRPIPSQLKLSTERLTRFLIYETSEYSGNDCNTITGSGITASSDESKTASSSSDGSGDDFTSKGITDTEKLLCFLKNFIDENGISKNKRHTLLHKAWSIPMTVHAFWALVDFFKCN